MGNRTCSIAGCHSKHAARGYCFRHYSQAKARGEFTTTSWTSDVERFWAKAIKTDTCWNFQSVRNERGYGYFSVGPRSTRKLVPAHRYAWELENGSIPPRMMLDHICRNTSCVRPTHLRLASNKENQEYRAGASRANRSSGVRNVHRSNSKSKPWKVSIKHNHKLLHFGHYATIEEAEAVAIRERARLFTRSGDAA